MPHVFLIFFLSAIFYSPALVAQTDSTFTDTVVIIKDPHVIRHEVVIRSPSEPVRKIAPWKFGLYYGIGVNKIKSGEPLIEVTGKDFSSFGIQIGYNLGHFEFGAGIGIINNTIKYNSQKTFVKVKNYREWAEVDRDTLEIRDTSTGAITMLIITVFNDSVSRQSHEILNYNIKSTYQRNFLQIPLSIGYGFDLPYDFKVTPGLQIIINQLISENGDEKPEKSFAVKTSFWQYGFYLKLEHNISDHFSAELKYYWVQCKGSVYKDDHNEVWKFTGLNLGINYNFGN